MKRKIVFVDPIRSSDLRSIDPHPYGCLPGGNVLLVGSSRRQIPLTDELWQQILGFLDGFSLGNVIGTCREFYVAGHEPELWRDLVLRSMESESIQDVTSKYWKDRFVRRHTSDKTFSHKPIRIPGIYSDYFYRTHLCRSFAIPEQWLTVDGGSIERINNISPEEFLKYESRNKPVVLSGACRSWKAMERWISHEYLDQKSLGRCFRATSGAAPLPINFTLKSYVHYCSTVLEEAPLYLFDRSALLEGSPLQDDYFPDLQANCPYIDPSRISENGHDLFQLLGEGARPDHTWLIVGPQRSGSSFHIDPNCTHAWNAAICGRKRWIFYPPGVTPPGVHPSEDGDQVVMPISLGEWLQNYWDEHLERYTDAVIEDRPLECTVEAGDLIFVPHGWWHAVVNLDPINVAVTHNYVSRSNLSDVLRFLSTKIDHISGCRDRKESIKPEDLHGAFVDKLREHFPQWLEEAEKNANEGWTCAAWKDQVTNESKDVKQYLLHRKKRKSKCSIMSKLNSSAEESIHTFAFSFGIE
jgi:Cupin-like domain